jgi:hypothetical protein
LLAGAPPEWLYKSKVDRHDQTYRLREYHLLEEYVDARNVDLDTTPLSSGEPLQADIPHEVFIQDVGNGLKVTEPERSGPCFYTLAPALDDIDAKYTRRIRDVLITGEVGPFLADLTGL